MFDLKRPCTNCPFKKGVGEMFLLSESTLDGILSGPSFQCHKTIDYNTDSLERGDKPQQCAGVMAILAKEGRPNQIMQVARRLGALDFDKLDPEGEAYGSIDEAREVHYGE